MTTNIISSTSKVLHDIYLPHHRNMSSFPYLTESSWNNCSARSVSSSPSATINDVSDCPSSLRNRTNLIIRSERTGLGFSIIAIDATCEIRRWYSNDASSEETVSKFSPGRFGDGLTFNFGPRTCVDSKMALPSPPTTTIRNGRSDNDKSFTKSNTFSSSDESFCCCCCSSFFVSLIVVVVKDPLLPPSETGTREGTNAEEYVQQLKP